MEGDVDLLIGYLGSFTVWVDEEEGLARSVPT
jgi:hypothetical protein